MTDHGNVRENLLKLLEAFPSLAENYNSLCCHYWAIFDNATTLDGVSVATPVESITRNFRRLVESGAVKVPERVLKARQEKVKEFRSEFIALT